MTEQVFLFDFRVDLADRVPEQAVDIPVTHPKARAESARIDSDFQAEPQQWAVVTVRDKGATGKAKNNLALIVVRHSSNGLTMLPKDAGKLVATVKIGVLRYTYWSFFERVERASPGKTAEVSAAPPPRTPPSSCPEPEPPIEAPKRMF